MNPVRFKEGLYGFTQPSSGRFLIYFLLPTFIAVVLVSLFADFLPTVFGAYADQRFFQLGLLWVTTVIALVWKFPSSECEGLLSTNWPALLVSVAFLLMAIPDSSGGFSWVEPGMYSLYFAAFTVVGWRIYEQGVSLLAAVLLIYVVTISCFFYAAMTMTVYLFAISDEFSTLTDIIPWGFVNMRYWSHIATWLLPILPMALLSGPLGKNRLWRVGVGFTAAIWWWMIFMTTARGSMLSVVLAGMVVWLLYGRVARPWLVISFRFVVFGGLAWFMLSLAIPSMGSEELTVRSIHAGGSGRMPLWLEAWNMSLQHFPFGLGPQSWITHQAITDGFPADSRLGHPHNMYLMWAAEYGWLLIVAVLVLVAATLRNVVAKAHQVRAGTDQCPAVLAAFTASAVAGLVHAGFSAVFVVPASMLVGFLVLSVFWSLILRRPSQVNKISNQGRSTTTQLVLAMAITLGGVMWFTQVWEYHQAMVADLSQYEERPNAAYWPRFWFHGNFPRPEG